MKITKYEHSCMTVEQNGQILVIDPGAILSSIPALTNVTGVVVTHIHPDHLSKDHLQNIYAANPNISIYTVPAVMEELSGSGLPLVEATPGETVVIGEFTLAFTGGEHAVIHPDTPITDNVAFTVNNTFYVTGDALTIPHLPIEVLSVPISAPWMRVAEAMDFIAAVKPKQVFPVHDALLSEFGNEVNNRWLEQASTKVGAKYIVLKPGNSISV